MRIQEKILFCFYSSTFLFGFYLFSYKIQRDDTFLLLTCYTLLFVILYLWIRKYNSLIGVFIIGLICRALFWEHIPSLSEDFYRFLWDGNIQLLGINPYQYNPSQIVDSVIFPNSSTIYNQMSDLSLINYTNYPPLSQYLFKLICHLDQNGILNYVKGIRCVYLIGEICLFFGTKFLLEYLKLDPKYIVWYFLNPLVIIEGFGNLHSESFMLCFTIFSWIFCFKKNPFLGGLFMAIAIGIKLLPLLFIPFFFRFLGYRKFILFALISGFFSIIIWFPFFNGIMIENYLNTIRLWFNYFEFNGSIYKIIRFIGYKTYGYNIIRQLGNITPYINIGLIFCFSLLYSNLNNKRIFESLLLFLSCYFFISTTIHPWYIINLILVGIISGYAFPIIWSLTVFWSYNAYSSNAIQENIVLQLFSYCLVYGCFFYEIYYKKLGHHLQKPNFFSS